MCPAVWSWVVNLGKLRPHNNWKGCWQFQWGVLEVKALLEMFLVLLTHQKLLTGGLSLLGQYLFPEDPGRAAGLTRSSQYYPAPLAPSYFGPKETKPYGPQKNVSYFHVMLFLISRITFWTLQKKTLETDKLLLSSVQIRKTRRTKKLTLQNRTY